MSNFEIESGLDISHEAYNPSFLEEIVKRLKIKNEAQKEVFLKTVLYTGGRYLDLKRMNSNRIQPHKQNQLFEDYKGALARVIEIYREIYQSTAASGKFGKALRSRYLSIEDEAMRQMFEPYCNQSGLAIDMFPDFLQELAVISENAKSQDVGNDKADLSGKFLIQWVTALGKAWPKSAGVTFALGKWDSELKIYASPSIPILKDILSQLEKDVSQKNIETMMRQIIKENLLDQPVASFFLR